MSDRKIIIIGGGIAGLAAGCYARMNGYEAVIHEAHSMAGGQCVSWERKGFTIDGSLHWLTGARRQGMFYQFWDELGAAKDLSVYDHEAYMRWQAPDGREVIWWRDPKRLERHLLELSPADAKPIHQLCRLVRKIGPMPLPTDKPFSLLKKHEIFGVILRLIPYGGAFKQLTEVSIGGFASRFQSPLIAASLRQLIFCENVVLMGAASTLGMLGTGGSASPMGGSLVFTRAIEKRFLDLGGTLRLNSPVERIEVADGRALGIVLADGSHEQADWVVAACDLGLTLDKLLEGKFPSPEHRGLLEASTEKYQSAVQVTFGIAGRLDWPVASLFQNLYLDEPIAYPGGRTNRLVLKDYGPDPLMAPAGKSVVTAMVMVDDPKPWLDLASDRAAYLLAKDRIAAQIAAAIERAQPGFRARIEMTDVATPHTYRRYTGTLEGRFMSYVMTPDNANRMQAIPQTVPGVEGLYLAGMWLSSPGGVPGAAKTARDALQLICHTDRRRFTARKA